MKVADILADMVATVAWLEEQGAPEGVSANALDAQIRGLILARELGKLASKVAQQHEKAIAFGTESGDMLDGVHCGASVQVRGGMNTKGWKQEELRAAVRPLLVWNEDEDLPRTGAEVLNLLWDDETGLQPLNLGMRTKALREVYGIDIDDFAVTEYKTTVQVMAGAEAVLADALGLQRTEDG